MYCAIALAATRPFSLPKCGQLNESSAYRYHKIQMSLHAEKNNYIKILAAIYQR